MAKIGVEIRIKMQDIDKNRLYRGEKGSYLAMTTFIDLDNQDQYGNNGFIAHKKEQGEQGNTPILGNSKVFWSDMQQSAPQPQQQAYQQQAPQRQAPPPQQPQGVQQVPQNMNDDFDDSQIPF